MNQEGAKMPFYPKKEGFVSEKSKILQMNDKYLNLFCYICTN